MFSQNTPQNTKHAIYTFCILRKFCVLLMPRKNKPKILWLCARMPTLGWNANSKKKDAKHKKNYVKYPTIHFLFFTFCDRFQVYSRLNILREILNSLVGKNGNMLSSSPYKISVQIIKEGFFFLLVKWKFSVFWVKNSAYAHVWIFHARGNSWNIWKPDF